MKPQATKDRETGTHLDNEHTTCCLESAQYSAISVLNVEKPVTQVNAQAAHELGETLQTPR